jgi:hypothetical protein
LIFEFGLWSSGVERGNVSFLLTTFKEEFCPKGMVKSKITNQNSAISSGGFP